MRPAMSSGKASFSHLIPYFRNVDNAIKKQNMEEARAAPDKKTKTTYVDRGNTCSHSVLRRACGNKTCYRAEKEGRIPAGSSYESWAAT